MKESIAKRSGGKGLANGLGAAPCFLQSFGRGEKSQGGVGHALSLFGNKRRAVRHEEIGVAGLLTVNTVGNQQRQFFGQGFAGGKSARLGDEQIGGIGMNDRGIAVMLNALRAEVPCQGIPLRARMRAMLEAETLSDAYVRGSHAPVSVANLIATHKDGVAIAFEMDSEIVEPMIPEDGVLLHTNHYIGTKMYLKNDVNHMGSSYIRLQRVRSLVKECHGKITVEDVMRMLQDHAGYPQSICDHEDMRDPLVKRDATNFAVIMDLTGDCMYLAPGNPCENAFEKYYI